MNNKGTQALFKSDVEAIKSIFKKNLSVSVSTTDIEGVKRLDLPLDAVLPPMVDLPYDRADQLIRKVGGNRTDLRYKRYASSFLLYMLLQIVLTVCSIFLVKLGLKALYRHAVVDCVRHSDLVVSHSDENFKETASLLPLNPVWVITWWSMLISRTCEILVAKSFGKPVVMFPNSVGPFRTWMGRFLARLSLNNCNCVLIRDSISYAIVKRLGIKASKILTYDTALLYTPQSMKVGNDFPRPTLAVSPGIYSRSLSQMEVDNYIQAHARALDAAIEKHGFFVVFLPHYVSGFPYDDLEVSKLILHNMKNKHRVQIVNTAAVEEFKRCLDQVDMIISSKMHPAVLGASGYVPLLCILYDHKQTSFFERLGMIDCTLGIRMVSPQNLSSKIDYVWNQNDQLRALLRKQIPNWQKNTSNAIRNAVTYHVKAKSDERLIQVFPTEVKP